MKKPAGWRGDTTPAEVTQQGQPYMYQALYAQQLARVPLDINYSPQELEIFALRARTRALGWTSLFFNAT